jgi:hypothetical protein
MTIVARNIFKVASASMNLLSSTFTLLFFLRDMPTALSSLVPLLDYLTASSPRASLLCFCCDCHISFSPALVASSLHAFLVSLTTASPHSAKAHHLCKNKAIYTYSLLIPNILQVYTKTKSKYNRTEHHHLPPPTPYHPPSSTYNAHHNPHRHSSRTHHHTHTSSGHPHIPYPICRHSNRLRKAPCSCQSGCRSSCRARSRFRWCHTCRRQSRRRLGLGWAWRSCSRTGGCVSIEEAGRWRNGENERGRRACRSRRRRWSGRRSMRRGGRLRTCSAVGWSVYCTGGTEWRAYSGAGSRALGDVAGTVGTSGEGVGGRSQSEESSEDD